jgi:hypothetical protein
MNSSTALLFPKLVQFNKFTQIRTLKIRLCNSEILKWWAMLFMEEGLLIN